MGLSHEPASAEKPQLNLGYMRLTDSAPLIIAKENGLFERHGLTVTLSREMSWANIRDKVAVGALDAAQMLAPMPLSASFGIDGVRTKMLTGLMLSLNGNAITVAAGLADTLAMSLATALDPVASARLLRQRITNTGMRPTFATVYPFSTHTFMLRLWLAAGGINPDTQVRIIVLPPQQMVTSLANGIIDGFCVGEPWNSLAVQAGVGTVLTTGYQIWNNAPEKVLAVTARWHSLHPATHLRLRLALMEAAAWLADPENRIQAAHMLAAPEYLDLPEKAIHPALFGNFQFTKMGGAVSIPDCHVFHRYQAGFPWRSRAEWLLQQSAEMVGKAIAREQLVALAQETYRTDLYREAARLLDWPSPHRDTKTEGFHDQTHVVPPGVALGPDLILGGKTFTPSTG